MICPSPPNFFVKNIISASFSVKKGMGKKTTVAKPINKNSGPSKDLPVKPQGFAVPEGLLSQLNECSNGGYILIAVDENGQPRVYAKYDNPMSAIGIVTFGEKFLKGQSAYIAHSIEFGRNPSPPEEEA